MNTFEIFCNEYSYRELRGICNHFYSQYNDMLSNIIDIEDYFQTICIKLYKDSNFDDDRASIRTYVNIKIKYATFTLVRDLKAKKRLLNYNTLSIDSPVNTTDDLYLADMLEDENNSFDIIESNNCLDKICELIPKEKQKIIFKMHIQGYSFVEIGKKVNLTNKQVNQIFQTVKKRLQRMDYAVNNILR